MKLYGKITCCFVLLFTVFSTADAQLYKIDLENKVKKASLIIEGRVTEQHSFWNDEHTIIYTSNTIHAYKIFKGQIFFTEIEVITQGGSIGNKCLKVSDVLQLQKDQTGIFFLYENALKIRSPLTKKILYDVYSSDQGFLRYDNRRKKAFAPFAKYENIEQTLYKLIRKQTGIKEKIIDNSISASLGDDVVSNGTTESLIVSFSPATVYAGAINDDDNNILTINGSGFGKNPSSPAGIRFKDANNDHDEPDYKIAHNSPYIISWTDTKIMLNVPDRVGTGKFEVIAADGSKATSDADLKVFFSVIDAQFENGSNNIVKEGRLMNANNAGGYSIQYSTSTAGDGIDFTASPAQQTFQRALTAWKEITGANLIEGTPVTLQKIEDDEINLVVFDNNNTGVPKMADGVLESTYSWYSACTQGTQILSAQKTGFDILLRNDKVSTGDDVSFEEGPCFPSIGSYDLEMIIMHELGHALNLSHINDDLENGGGGYPTVNPSKLMHYALLDYVDRRSPDASAYQGVLYTVTPQHNTYGSCGLFTQEMLPLTAIAASNDECPSTFPSAAIEENTIVSFDLVHATSNKFVDPSFKQVNCNGSGTSITNNVYYAFSNGTQTNLNLEITNYTTVPDDLNSCSGQTVRMALYDVQSCPTAQLYPAPVVCASFKTNGTIDISGLQQNHKYLLYFDGARNTKAFFNVVFNGNGSNPGTQTIVEIFPNPVINDNCNIRIINTSGTFYEYALFDAIGKKLVTGKFDVTLPTQTFNISMKNAATGAYFLRLIDETGKTVAKKKIIKHN